MFKANYVQFNVETGKGENAGWLYIYPRTGPIMKDTDHGLVGVVPLELAMSKLKPWKFPGKLEGRRYLARR